MAFSDIDLPGHHASTSMQNLRIDFQFDKAAFDFKKLPFKIPYPVPFKLLGDETKVGCPHPYRENDMQNCLALCLQSKEYRTTSQRFGLDASTAVS